MAKYKLVQKINPSNKEAAKKWYAVPKSDSQISGKAMTKEATANTSMAPIELEAALELLAKYVPAQLQRGHTVKLPGLGTFRLCFKSAGADTVEEFKVSTMIKNPRVVFTPSREFSESVLSGLTFENAGVLADDIFYGSVAAYNLVKNSGGTPSEPEEDRPEVQ